MCMTLTSVSDRTGAVARGQLRDIATGDDFGAEAPRLRGSEMLRSGWRWRPGPSQGPSEKGSWSQGAEGGVWAPRRYAIL